MEEKENIILKLTFEFSIAIIEFAELLELNRKFVIANQVLKSGTLLVQMLGKHKMQKVKPTSFIKLKLH